MNADVTVIVQSVAGRGVVWERSRASIEASDIGTDYEVMVHPPGITVLAHFRTIMERARQAPTRLVLFLEDDALVNRHILHNVTAWKDVDDIRFGVGWLLNPGGAAFNILDYIYNRRADGRGRWLRRPYLHIAAGLLFRTADLAELLPHVYEWQEQQDGKLPHTDLAVSQGVWRMGRHICVHAPSLVEHQCTTSKLGHAHQARHSTSRGTFQVHWRRKEHP